MLRFHTACTALITVGCLLVSSTATAGGAASRPRVLVAQFGERSGAASEAMLRENHLASQPESEFSALEGDAVADRLGSPAPAPAPFLRIPIARVPEWMRTGRRTGTWRAGASGIAPPGSCAARPYIPSSLLGRSAEERRRMFYPLVQSAACDAGLPVGLMDAMLMQESRYNPLALSPKGAFGLGQLMPGTARQLKVDRYDLRGNLAGAARYLRQHIDEFGQVPLALAAYNAGPGRVRKAWSVPRITETQNYVRQILLNWRALELGAVPLVSRQMSGLSERHSIVSQFP